MAVGEKVIVVDKNDKVIRYQLRTTTTKQDIVRCVVVWIEDGQGRALVQKRSLSKLHGPGRWENAAGGAVSHNETYEDAAYKELFEEIGLTGIELKIVAKKIVTTDQGDRYCCYFKGFTNWTIDKFVLEENSVADIKWVNKIDLFDSRDKNPEHYMPSSINWRELFKD